MYLFEKNQIYCRQGVYDFLSSSNKSKVDSNQCVPVIETLYKCSREAPYCRNLLFVLSIFVFKIAQSLSFICTFCFFVCVFVSDKLRVNCMKNVLACEPFALLTPTQLNVTEMNTFVHHLDLVILLILIVFVIFSLIIFVIFSYCL